MVCIILGNNIDTFKWIEYLRLEKKEVIIVVDYDHIGDPRKFNGVEYISYLDGKRYLEKFRKVNFYKSLYVYPDIKEPRSPLLRNEEDNL